MRAAIIGAGAAGLTAAIFAKRTFPSAQVTVFEGNDRVGKKILATGNGRCNLSNRFISAANYASRSPKLAAEVLKGYGFDFDVEFFKSIGIPVTVEDGRAYPRSMRAAAVVDALRFECARRGVEVKTNTRVRDVKMNARGFFVDGQSFDRLAVTAGGRAFPSSGSDGFGFELARSMSHRVFEPYPALVQLRTENGEKSLKGIRVCAKASAVVNGRIVREETGEVQFCDYGLSGIPILQLSPLFAGRMEVVLDLFPDMELSLAVSVLTELAENTGDLPFAEFMGGFFHKNLTRRICAQCDLDPIKTADQMTVGELKRFAAAAKELRFKVVGTNSWPDAQATRGGVDLREIDPKTMESRLKPGLYFAGEALDVCGDCGGYNLHWAWVSGARCGKNLCKE